MGGMDGIVSGTTNSSALDGNLKDLALHWPQYSLESEQWNIGIGRIWWCEGSQEIRGPNLKHCAMGDRPLPRTPSTGL